MPITFFARRSTYLSAAALLLVVAAGCEQSKTANPLSPQIAGPLANVDITVPKALEPGTGWKIEDKNQPITLLIENPSSSSPRPFTLRVEVATDATFANAVFTANNIGPGPNGRTAVRLPDKLAPGRSYLWRARAEDGANNSEWSAAAQFDVLMPIFIGTPVAKSPVGNVRVESRTPTLVAANAVTTGPHGALFYFFQISGTDTFGGQAASAEAPVNPGGETSLAIPSALPYDTTVYWRVRITDGLNVGAWSKTEVFRTPVAPVVVPPPPPPGGGSGGGGGGTGGSCAGNNGDAIVQCIAAKYPQYLVPVGSLGQRQSNMMFLRDRIIEAGRCGGLDLAWNLKRGGPEISIDFLVHMDNGTLRGIDIAFDYDNISTPLKLYWGEGTFPYYGGYPQFSCSGV
jgi:hypothetical protein